MSLSRVLVHRARRHDFVAAADDSEWVDGEVPESEVFGTPFACCLFLPQGGETGAGRGRRTVEPTMLFSGTDTAGGAVALSAKDEILVTAAELNVAQGLAADVEVRWMVVGAPQPFGKPGRPVVGLQATLRRIDD